MPKFNSPEFWWIIFGFGAQFMFFMRFVIQWFYSEKHKRSVIPIYFWYFSLVGGVMILIYSIHIEDIVFITAQALSLVVYIRNLALIRKSGQGKLIG